MTYRPANTIVAVSDGLDDACRLLAKAALVAMVAVVTLQIAARYGFRSPPAWTEELARYLMVWGGLLGATIAFRRAADPAIVMVGEEAGRRKALAARLAVAAVVVIFVTPILYFSFFGPGVDPGRSFLMRSAARTTPALGISLVWIAAAIPAFCLITLIHLTARLVAGPRAIDAEPHATDFG